MGEWPVETKKPLAVTQYECFRNQAKVSTVIAGFMVVRQDKADAAVVACGDRIAELEAELTAAINIAVTARQNYDENGNGFRPLADIEAEVRKDVKRLAGKKT